MLYISFYGSVGMLSPSDIPYVPQYYTAVELVLVFTCVQCPVHCGQADLVEDIQRAQILFITTFMGFGGRV